MKNLRDSIFSDNMIPPHAHHWIRFILVDVLSVESCASLCDTCVMIGHQRRN